MSIAYTPPIPPRRGNMPRNPAPRGLDWATPRTPYVDPTKFPAPSGIPRGTQATPMPKAPTPPAPVSQVPNPLTGASVPVTPEPSYLPPGGKSAPEMQNTAAPKAVDPNAGYTPGFLAPPDEQPVNGNPPVPNTPGNTNPNNPPPISPYPNLGLDFARTITPNELVANQLQALLNRDSPYMRNAEQRGIEMAQRRGNLNSSIAAGSARRAALEAAAPIAQADAQAWREANSQNFEALSQLRQMRTAADLEDWLNDRSFNRDFNGRLATMPIQSAMDMLQYVSQRAMEDPAVYTPQVMSGFMNFFNQNLFDIMNQYFGSNYGTNPQGGG